MSEFELTEDLDDNDDHTVKNIKSIYIDGVLVEYFTDYDYDVEGINAGRITFVSAPADDAEIKVEYMKGDSWIYSDFPRVDISLSNYPRVGFVIQDGATAMDGLGG